MSGIKQKPFSLQLTTESKPLRYGREQKVKPPGNTPRGFTCKVSTHQFVFAVFVFAA